MRRYFGFSFLFVLMLASAVPATAQAPTPTPTLRALIEKLEARAAADFAQDKLGSVTVGLVSGADLVWTRSYGFADMEKKVPATRETVYRIGSITKQFTALMLLQLAEKGKVRLSDPVEKYLPEVNKIQGRDSAVPITLLQLATHTSGLDAEPAELETFLVGAVADWEKVLLSALPKTRFAAEPGERYSYSNIGYAILGAALGRAAREPYVEYVTRQILQPLGMGSTFFEPNEEIRPRLAQGYLGEDDGTVDAETALREHRGRGYKVPNGALYTTVDDLARFVAFELGEDKAQVLARESLDENFRRLVSANGSFKRGYGVGFQVIRLGDVVLYGHSGGVAGYQAEAYFERGSRLGVIVLRSAIGGSFDPAGLVRAVFEKPPG